MSVLTRIERLRSPDRREAGQAYVEFALILPILLLLVMGIIAFSNAFRTYITLTDATRVGARQAAVSMSVADSQRVAKIESTIKNAAVNLDTSKIGIQVTATKSDGTPGWEPTGDVTVRTSYPLQIDVLGLVVFNSTINSRTTERVE